MALTEKQQRFVEAYLIEPVAKLAAIKAGYSSKSPDKIGSQLLDHPGVVAALAAARDARAARTNITADSTLELFWNTATADPNELVEIRRTCCRCCWGKNNQWHRTNAEMARDRAEWRRMTAAHQANPGDATCPDPGPFDEKGGTGYDARQPPSHACEYCFGEGVPSVFAKDTRNLSPRAKCLYAGAKQTKDGIEVKMHDQAHAREKVAQHLGMFVHRHEHSGPGGAPIPVNLSVFDDDVLAKLETILGAAVAATEGTEAAAPPAVAGTGEGGTGAP